MGLLKKVARYNRPQAPSLNSSIPRHPRAKCRAADHAKRCGNDAFATVPLRGRNRGRVSEKKKICLTGDLSVSVQNMEDVSVIEENWL